MGFSGAYCSDARGVRLCRDGSVMNGTCTVDTWVVEIVTAPCIKAWSVYLEEIKEISRD